MRRKDRLLEAGILTSLRLLVPLSPCQWHLCTISVNHHWHALRNRHGGGTAGRLHWHEWRLGDYGTPPVPGQSLYCISIPILRPTSSPGATGRHGTSLKFTLHPPILNPPHPLLDPLLNWDQVCFRVPLPTPRFLFANFSDNSKFLFGDSTTVAPGCTSCG